MDRKRIRSISPPLTKRRKLSPSAPSIPKSDTTSPPDSPSTMRIFAWNINGISPFLQKPITNYFTKVSSPNAKSKPQPASLRDFLKRHHWPQMLLLQEVKINPNDEKTQAAVRTAINTALPGETPAEREIKYTAHFTLPRDPHNARGFGGRVYGIASLIRSDFSNSHVSRVREVDWDLEGRIHVIELKCKVAVFNIYAVNGTENPYRSPKTGAVMGTRHDRKLALHRLLLEECQRLEREGWRVVIAGDLNIARDARDGWPRLRTWPEQHCRNREDFNEKFFEGDEGLKAVDVWREMKGGERRYTYFPRGREWGSSCDRVDLIIVSRKLWDDGEVRGTGILDSEEERGPSDHVPLWIEIGIGEAGKAEDTNKMHDGQ